MSILSRLFESKEAREERIEAKRLAEEAETKRAAWLQPPSEAAAERPEAEGIICDRCNQSSIQRMEGDKYWCSWCNDWALGVGTSGEGKPGRRFVPPSGAAAGSYCSNCGRYPLPEGGPRSPTGERVCNECWKSAPCVCFCRGCKKSFQSEAGMWRQYCPKCDAYWGGRVKDAFGGKYTGLR
jgi:hypothetical protein